MYSDGNVGPNQIAVQTGTAELFAQSGSAQVEQLTSASHMSAGTFQLSFDYDASLNGNSAVAFFFGSDNDAFPFPVVQYDNIMIGTTTAVPEASTTVVLGMTILTVALFVRRRRPTPVYAC